MNLITIIIIIIIILILLGCLYCAIKYYKQNGGVYTKEDIQYFCDNHEEIQREYFKFVMENDLTNVFDSIMLWVFYHKDKEDLNEFYYNYFVFHYKFGWKIHIGVKPQYQIDFIRIIYKYYTETNNIYEFKHMSYFPSLIDDEVEKFVNLYKEYAENHEVSEKMKEKIKLIETKETNRRQFFKIMAMRYPPIIQETFGRSKDPIKTNDINEIIFDPQLHQDSKFITIYPMDDANAKLIIHDLIELFDNYLKENKLEWDKVFVGVGTDFEIKKGISVRFCEFADLCEGISKSERYTPGISNIIVNKFLENCIVINNLCNVPEIIDDKIQIIDGKIQTIANKNFVKIATIPFWEKFFEKKEIGEVNSIELDSNQLVITTEDGNEIFCNKLKKYELTPNNRIIDDYINKPVIIYDENKKIENKIEVEKEYNINNEPPIPIFNMKNNYKYDDKNQDIKELIENEDYIFSESNCYNCNDKGDEYIIETSAKTKSLIKNEKVDKYADEFIGNIYEKKYDKLEINSILNVLAVYPEIILHLYSYFNNVRMSIFRGINNSVLYKILYHLIHSDDIIETKIIDNYQHPFDNLYYRLNDNYKALLLPKKIKYINPVIDIYNILFADRNVPNYHIYREVNHK